MSSYEREPTPDEAAMMKWWNGLTVVARVYWASQLADPGAPIVDVWANYKAKTAAKKTTTG
jgi:hypothetical protein